MKKNELTYREALEKLQELVSQIENPDRDPETLPEDVKKAQLLLGICRKHLRDFDSKLEELTGEQQ
ncbi:MAG: exodeoxyribonuclease VII small subunit [Bacteroidales bacterium]|jgi:exodeoxyribonuclease VII small subunit|nr:exodeoxyribonuclease VII small subunit [Bacteroidales bacterium]